MTKSVEIGRFKVGDATVIGVIDGEGIQVVSEADNLREVLQGMPGTLEYQTRSVALADATFLATLDPDSRVFAIAVNYVAHGAEASKAPPPRPLAFYKAPTNFVGHQGTLDAHQELTQKFDYEGEIGIVIGKRCFKASEASALDYVAGVCAVNDGSARDLTTMRAGTTAWVDWTAAKALDGASAIGPSIVCSAEVIAGLGDQTLTFETRLNGDIVQEGKSNEMVFSPRKLIAVLSSYMTLLPGDVIATGTPAGVGMARNRFLTKGDQLEIQISGHRALQMTVG